MKVDATNCEMCECGGGGSFQEIFSKESQIQKKVGSCLTVEGRGKSHGHSWEFSSSWKKFPRSVWPGRRTSQKLWRVGECPFLFSEERVREKFNEPRKNVMIFATRKKKVHWRWKKKRLRNGPWLRARRGRCQIEPERHSLSTSVLPTLECRWRKWAPVCRVLNSGGAGPNSKQFLVFFESSTFVGEQSTEPKGLGNEK